MQNNLCLCCLNTGHTAVQCNLRTGNKCRTCHYLHHHILGCKKQPVKNTTTDEQPAPLSHHDAQAYFTGSKPPDSNLANLNTCLWCLEEDPSQLTNHELKDCFRFGQISREERGDFMMDHEMCMICLRSGHFPDQCDLKPQNECGTCSYPHHRIFKCSSTVLQ